jgi:adenylate kinase family enzyme
MRRVMVIGCSGAGKTTFARALAEATGLPLVSIDRIHWQPGWREPEPEWFRARMIEEAEKPAWIMDGNFFGQGAGRLRLDRADVVYWFDLPTAVCLVGVLTRITRGYGRVRPEMARGCPEHFDVGFLRYVLGYRRTYRPHIETAMATVRPDQRLVQFTRRRQAREELVRLRASSSPQPA